MDNRKFLIKFLFSFSVIFSVFSVLFTSGVYARTTTVSVIPSSGNYLLNQTFIAEVRINGNGEIFNAAKADISIPSSLSVRGLTLGTCHFAYVKTPIQSNPSFVGVILGGSSGNCTAYTLTLQAVSAGQASINVSNASVKEYKTAQEILSTSTSASYTVQGGTDSSVASLPSPTAAPENKNGVNHYTVSYSPGVENAQVVMDSNTPEETTKTTQSGGKISSAVFNSVPAGVHTIETFLNGQKISSQVVNVSGSNKNIIFGSIAGKGFTYWIFLSILALILVIIGIMIIVTYQKLKRRVVA